MSATSTRQARRGSDEFVELIVESHVPIRVVGGYRKDRQDRAELRKSLRELVRVIKAETVRDMQHIPWADRPTRADSLLRRLWERVKPPIDAISVHEGRVCRVCGARGTTGRRGGMADAHADDCPIPEVTAYLTGGDER